MLVGLADIMQHMHCSSSLIKAVLNYTLIGNAQRVDIVASSEREMKNMVSLLGLQLKERFGFAEFIRERAKNQLTVVWFLPMHWVY